MLSYYFSDDDQHNIFNLLMLMCVGSLSIVSFLCFIFVLYSVCIRFSLLSLGGMESLAALSLFDLRFLIFGEDGLLHLMGEATWICLLLVSFGVEVRFCS